MWSGFFVVYLRFTYIFKMENTLGLQRGNIISDIWAEPISPDLDKRSWIIRKFTDKKVWYGYPNDYSSDIKNIIPVKLTKKWLDDFGFDVNSGKYFKGTYDKDYFEVSEFRTDDDDIFFGYSAKHGVVVRLDYVHQLQNLYYAHNRVLLSL